MISESAVLSKFIDFIKLAAPILYLKNAEAYEDALRMVEHLMEVVGEDDTKPENLLINLLAHAIEKYESSKQETAKFINDAAKVKGDAALLRFIIDQHQLMLSDLPEIGHKSLVSKILSGERNLTKAHVAKLSKRFGLNPSLFF